MRKRTNANLSELRGEIRRLQERAGSNGHGRYIELIDHSSDGKPLYKVTANDGEGFDPEHPLDKVAGGGWPQPVIAFVTSKKRQGNIGYDIIDNTNNWINGEAFTCALTEKGAESKAYQRAKKIAKVIARRTKFPLIERTSRYSGTVEFT